MMTDSNKWSTWITISVLLVGQILTVGFFVGGIRNEVSNLSAELKDHVADTDKHMPRSVKDATYAKKECVDKLEQYMNKDREYLRDWMETMTKANVTLQVQMQSVLTSIEEIKADMKQWEAVQ